MSMLYAQRRRDVRRAVEMFARLRCGMTTKTVLLKDLTRHGARIEGIGPFERDEAVSLTLPGRRPLIAFIAWSNQHCAGLEFAEALSSTEFGALIAKHGLNTGSIAVAA
ncbi:MAG: hypothetical protein N2423_03875 [Novosphingobium sp.]|nr:hypothetical protein [Novosphingobium sp.]